MSRVEQSVELAALPSNREVDLAAKRVNDFQDLVDSEVPEMAGLQSRNASFRHSGAPAEIGLAPAPLDA